MTDSNKIEDFVKKYVLLKDKLNRVLVSKKGLKDMVNAYNDIYEDKTSKERSVGLTQLISLALNKDQQSRLALIEGLTRGGNFATLVESGVLEATGFGKQERQILEKGMLDIELPIKTADYFFETPKSFTEAKPPIARTGIEVEEEEKEDQKPKGLTEAELKAMDSGAKRLDEYGKELKERKQMAKEDKPKLRGSAKTGKGFVGEEVSKPSIPMKPIPPKQDKPKATTLPSDPDKPVRPTMTEPMTPPPQTPRTTPKTPVDKAKEKREKASQRLRETIESISPDEPPDEPPTMAEAVPEPMPEPIKLTTNKKKDSKVIETEVKTGLEDIPSKIDLIPPERLSSEFKSAKELESDINYFFKTFPKQLEKIKKTYVKAKKSPEYLKRTHKRIVAILRAGAKESKEKVGVIIEGSEFIKDKLREIYLEEISKGLTAEDLIMNVEKEKSKEKGDIGFYEIKKGASGKEHSQREPIYGKVPIGDEFNPKDEFTKKPARLNTLPTEYRSRFTYENTMYNNNPFTKPQSRIQLRKLY